MAVGTGSSQLCGRRRELGSPRRRRPGRAAAVIGSACSPWRWVSAFDEIDTVPLLLTKLAVTSRRGLDVALRDR
jgi:hypothetical protein